VKHSHPPSLLKLTLRTALDAELFRAGDIVLVAVSGGPDSMALLSVMAHLARRFDIALIAHGVDHGLRAEANAELGLAGELARKLGVPFGTTRVEVSHGPNLMARARQARYAALRAALVEQSGGRAGLIATGHQADDRAETFILRLMRGAGPGGLAVLPPRAGDLVRPLIRARRRDILVHLEHHAIEYAEDPSNQNPRFLRSRVRHEILPVLARFSPRIVEHLCALADTLADPSETPSQLGGRTLGRAQRLMLARAMRTGNSKARIPIGDGKVAGFDLSNRRFVLMDEE
jgi:tRNA(Ile)-lysidine synthase